MVSTPFIPKVQVLYVGELSGSVWPGGYCTPVLSACRYWADDRRAQLSELHSEHASGPGLNSGVSPLL